MGMGILWYELSVNLPLWCLCICPLWSSQCLSVPVCHGHSQCSSFGCGYCAVLSGLAVIDVGKAVNTTSWESTGCIF